MKVWYFLVMITGLMIFLKMAGIPAGTSAITDAVGIGFSSNSTIQSVSLTNSSFFNEIFGSTGFLILAVGAGIVVGFLTKQSAENFIILPLVTVIGVSYIGTLYGLITYAVGLQSILVSSLLSLILIPLTSGFIVSLVEFFRGTD
ncbi:MAG: hypothetical protein M0R17_06045 [Candidatus Omnitrophica bacterium]|jgi:hypothetical protein|nr:hypothetical protein [Candidatus Omnitrophota bacterium]